MLSSKYMGELMSDEHGQGNQEALIVERPSNDMRQVGTAVSAIVGGFSGLMISFWLSVEITPKVKIVRWVILLVMIALVIGIGISGRKWLAKRKSAFMSILVSFIASFVSISLIIFTLCWLF